MTRGLVIWAVLAAAIGGQSHVNASNTTGGELKSPSAREGVSARDSGMGTPPRKIPSTTKPEIVVVDGQLRFDGRLLVFGHGLDEWKRVIGGAPVCARKGEKPAWCKWDSLGIEIATRLDNADYVNEFRVRFRKAGDNSTSDEKVFSPDEASGAPWTASGAFPGHFELEGVGVNADTRFSEIRRFNAGRYVVKCGLQTCRFPKGAYGKELSIYMVLDDDTEYGRIREFTLSLPQYSPRK